MKRCPVCGSVFDDALLFCTNDGTSLVEETFALPSELTPSEPEEETVIRYEPLNINISGAGDPASPPVYATPEPPVADTSRSGSRGSWKYVVFLLVGLFLGGGIVLGAVVLGLFLYQSRPVAGNVAVDRKTPASPSPTPQSTPRTVEADEKHASRTDVPDDQFNGRVITLNAYLRFLPNKSATQVDILPVDDRIHIEDRAGEKSPWFRVTCEHGSTGWMHGNTIEYTR